MRTRARERRHPEDLPEPEILPMMNILFMLVMVLMGMSAFLPIGIIPVQAPQYGGVASPSASADINLTIMLLPDGINLSVAGSMLKGDAGPLFPKIKVGDAKVYDFMALQARLESIKAQYPANHRVMIMADADVIYDDITHTMDAARASKMGRPMFDDVAFIPGVME